jgi:hypothetical protein
MQRSLLILFGAGLLAAPASANDDVAALTKGGLMGSEWAIDCSKPMSATNYYLSYGVGPNGGPVEQLRSTDINTARELRNVQPISAEWLLYTLIDTDHEAINILTRRLGNRMKSWWSVGQDGKPYIVNGKLDSGEPPWFEKCR